MANLKVFGEVKMSSIEYKGHYKIHYFQGKIFGKVRICIIDIRSGWQNEGLVYDEVLK